MTELDKSEFLSPEAGADARPRTFTPDEMVTCDACLRANPPTRGNCLYCGELLPAGETVQVTSAPQGSNVVAASNGAYVVLTRLADIDESIVERLAARLQLETPDLQTALSAKGTLPLTHVDSAEQAASLIDELRTWGINATLVNDSAIQSSADNRKIRTLEFSDLRLTGLVGASGTSLKESWSDLVLAVTGRLQITSVEDVVRRKRSGQKPLEHREMTADDSILDLYSRSGAAGWRIIASSFDFSCLAERKGMTAFENFRTLIEVLRERAPNLEVDNSYKGARQLLANVWPLVTSTRTGGLRRSGTGKVDTSTFTTTDNETQFNNYSRLLCFVKMQELA